MFLLACHGLRLPVACATTRRYTLWSLIGLIGLLFPRDPASNLLHMLVAIGWVGVLMELPHGLGIALRQFLYRRIVKALHEHQAYNLFYQAGQVPKLLPNMGIRIAYRCSFQEVVALESTIDG